jgi:hypothetical protein
MSQKAFHAAPRVAHPVMNPGAKTDRWKMLRVESRAHVYAIAASVMRRANRPCEESCVASSASLRLQ